MNFLKIENSEMRNKMDQLNEKLNEVLLRSNCEPYETGNTAADVSIPKNHHNEDKRAARLIPASLLL